MFAVVIDDELVSLIVLLVELDVLSEVDIVEFASDQDYQALRHVKYM